MSWLLNIGLALLAVLLLYALSALLWVGSMMLSCRKKGDTEYYTRQLALVLDVLGNVIGGPVWNLIFIKNKNAQIVKFGSRFDTMSFVFAMNRHNLTWAGIVIVNLLEKIDPGHLNDAVTNP